MIRKIISFTVAAVLFALLVALPLWLVKMSQFKAIGKMYASMVPPPTTVTALPVKEETWENTASATGSLVAVQGVMIGAEVAGKVTKIGFEAGAKVAAGDLLVQLDTSVEEAQLAAAASTAALANLNLQRARELRERNTNSAADLDAADAQAKQAAAQVENLRAVIAKKTVRAPFTGRLGLRLINLGQILKEGDPIVSLQTVDPIFADFSVPQQQLAEVRAGAVVRLETDAAPGVKFEGRVNAVNPDVDPVTRSVRVQATLDNPDGKLRPGMYANVDIVLPTPLKALAIPATSVLYAPYGDTGFVVDEQKDEKSGKTEQILRQQIVRLGEARGDFVAVLDGLKAGDVVVTSGAFKLRKGMPVVIDNTLTPKAELAPKPRNT